MAEPKENDFLDGVSDYEEVEDQEELIDIDEEVAQFDEIDAQPAAESIDVSYDADEKRFLLF